MEEKKERKQGGKKPGQKFKSLLVWDILQKRTDENHAVSIKVITDYLKTYGIEAERHSISRDINDLMELLNRGTAIKSAAVPTTLRNCGFWLSAFGLPSLYPKGRKKTF